MKHFPYILVCLLALSTSIRAIEPIPGVEQVPTIDVEPFNEDEAMHAIDSIPMPKPYIKPVSPWKFKGNIGVNMTGNGLANWSAGGQSNISLLAYSRMSLHFEQKPMVWDTNLNLEYGAIWKNQEYDQFQGTNDKIDLNSKFGFRTTRGLYVSAYFSFLSQFSYSRNYTNNASPNYITGAFLAPAYIDIGIGVDYNPFEFLSVYFSPVMGRTTTVYIPGAFNRLFAKRMQAATEKEDATLTHDDIARYLDDGQPCWGLERELKDKYNVWNYGKNGERRDYSKNGKTDMGMMLRAKGKYTIYGITAETMLELYTPYRFDKRKVYYLKNESNNNIYWVDPTPAEIEEKGLLYRGFYDNNRRFGNFDVRWELRLHYLAFNIIDINFFSDLRYVNGLRLKKGKYGSVSENFEDGAEHVQWKGTWGIGIGYSF